MVAASKQISWRFKITIHFLLACSYQQREVIAAAIVEEKKYSGGKK